MSSENVSVPDIHVEIGKSFEIHLYSRGGSTGYLWYLSEMPKGIVLVSTSATPVPPVMPGSQTRQSFTFVATAEVKGPLSFELLRIWQPTESADTRTYAVIVSATDEKSLEARMTAEAGSSRFLQPEIFRCCMPPIMPYGVPPADVKSDKFSDDCCTGPVLYPMYGVPTNLPGQSFQESVVESTNNCRIKYGVPWGLADADNCAMEYGFPADCAAGKGPVVTIYGFPPGPDAIIEADNAANCVVKYGMPKGVGKDDDNCTMKYGMPKPKPDLKKD